MVTEDSLRSNAPHMQTLHDHQLHYRLGVKEGDHAVLFKQAQEAEHAGRATSYAQHERAAGLVPRFRWIHDVPLNASNMDVRVNVLEDGEMRADKVQHCRWIPDLRVSKRNVFDLMRGGRVRWKIDNEPFNPLKNQGDNFEHNDGHGTQNLSVVFALLRMLAFLVDQLPQRCWAFFRAVWSPLGSTRLLWERRRALGYAYALASMRQLFEALLYGVKKSAPIFAVDSSSSQLAIESLGACVPANQMIPYHRGNVAPPCRALSACHTSSSHVRLRQSLQKWSQRCKPGSLPS